MSLPRPRLAAGLCVAGVLLSAVVVVQALQTIGAFGPSPSERVADAWSQFALPPGKRDLARIDAMAKGALADNPLQANAASLMAVVAEQRADRPRAAQLMQAAARLSRRDDIADFWLFNHYMDARRYDKAMLHGDALLRRRFQVVSQQVYPRILMSFNDPALADVVAKRLVMKPEWRGSFISTAVQGFQDPSSAFLVYSAIQRAGGQPTTVEIAPYLTRLLEAKKYEEAYLSWILFLPQSTVSQLENIYDGRFDGWPETPPFGWNFEQGVRGSIESAESYNGAGSALRIDFDALTAPKLPRQILILTPGTYRFSGKALTANEDSAGRVKWTISCDAAPDLLPLIPLVDTRGSWRPFAGVFTVPEGCKGQWLELKSIPGEQRANVEVWFDDLAIERVDTAG